MLPLFFQLLNIFLLKFSEQEINAFYFSLEAFVCWCGIDCSFGKFKRDLVDMLAHRDVIIITAFTNFVQTFGEAAHFYSDFFSEPVRFIKILAYLTNFPPVLVKERFGICQNFTDLVIHMSDFGHILVIIALNNIDNLLLLFFKFRFDAISVCVRLLDKFFSHSMIKLLESFDLSIDIFQPLVYSHIDRLLLTTNFTGSCTRFLGGRGLYCLGSFCTFLHVFNFLLDTFHSEFIIINLLL